MSSQDGADPMTEPVCIVGAGAFGTALANAFAEAGKAVTLVSRTLAVVTEISTRRTNSRCFPGIRLNGLVRAAIMEDMPSINGVYFCAVPNSSLLVSAEAIAMRACPGAVLVNLAKGIGRDGASMTLAASAATGLDACALKGPTFAVELVRGLPCAFTVGATNTLTFDRLKAAFARLPVRLDYSDDIVGVDYLGALKNIYAIALGIVDANYASTNLRFAVLADAQNELRELLGVVGGKPDTVFRYCGYADLGLTALNDMSRNRTLGLLIGKGFLGSTGHSGVVLEGLASLNRLRELLPNANRFPILAALLAFVLDAGPLDEFLARVVYQPTSTN